MGIEDIKEFNQSLTMSWAFYLLSLGAVATAVWVTSDVHTRFTLQNGLIDDNTADIKYERERTQKITNRLDDRIKALEKPNTDK